MVHASLTRTSVAANVSSAPPAGIYMGENATLVLDDVDFGTGADDNVIGDLMTPRRELYDDLGDGVTMTCNPLGVCE